MLDRLVLTGDRWRETPCGAVKSGDKRQGLNSCSDVSRASGAPNEGRGGACLVAPPLAISLNHRKRQGTAGSRNARPGLEVPRRP
jgi:hypothetical protein